MYFNWNKIENHWNMTDRYLSHHVISYIKTVWSKCMHFKYRNLKVRPKYLFARVNSQSDIAAGACTCLPALSMWDRLLLACDESGSPHRTAVAGPEPAHRSGRRERSRAEPVIWFPVRGQRRRRTPHCHEQLRKITRCVLLFVFHAHKYSQTQRSMVFKLVWRVRHL